jgi:hypothetical protein
MVLDHVEDCASLLRQCRCALKASGRLIVAVPHPFKDSGAWEERFLGGQRTYFGLRVTNYFAEGPVEKARFDSKGELRIDRIRSYKRGLATYYAVLRSAGFQVERLAEPQPQAVLESNANYQKAAQVPYFLVLECTL